MLKTKTRKKSLTRDPTKVNISKIADLEKLIPGDYFRAKFFYEGMPSQFVTYEGKTEDKVIIMIQEEQDLRNIQSLRIDLENISFTSRSYIDRGEVLIKKLEQRDVVVYGPTHPEYLEKRGLFEKNCRFRDPYL